MRFTPRELAGEQLVGAVSIHLVTAVSAGPPLGGLYLKPPSSGGLCDGVMTMPSAKPERRPRLYVMIACERVGVGYSRARVDHDVQSLAASTSSVVAKAGSDSACVSIAKNSGPSIPADWRYSRDRLGHRDDMIFVERVAKAEPRCPEVPNATRCAGIEHSGLPV